MNDPCEVLCAGIVVADHVCTPIDHLPAAGELVLADRLLLAIGGYLLMPGVKPETLAPVFAAARQAGAKTVLDVVTPGPANYLPWLEGLLPHVDVVLPNNHEAELITGEKEPIRQAERFQQMGA